MYKTLKYCRACQGEDLLPVFDMGVQPLANDFCLPDEDHAGYAPLQVVFCPRCTLSQLSVVVDPEILYRRYLYVTSKSDTMQRHFHRLLQDIESEGAGKRILEIGSNDGTFLEFATNAGYECCGVDPAENLTGDAKGMTISGFFTSTLAKEIVGHGGGDTPIILARHVFCHMDDWRDFMGAINILSNSKTLVCIEVPYVHDLLRKVEFDTIYHEHTSYLSLTALRFLLKDFPFRIHRVLRYGIHGGSIMIMLRHVDSASTIQPHLSADEYLSEDAVTTGHWMEFARHASAKAACLSKGVDDARKQGKVVCGFGASAKSTVMIHYAKLNLAFVTDNSPHKPGRCVPGLTTPIFDQADLMANHPDYAIMFAWNFEAEILAGQDKWRKRGGKFFVPSTYGYREV